MGSVPREETPRSSLSLSFCLLCEDTVRRRSSVSLEDSPHQGLGSAGTLILNPQPLAITQGVNLFSAYHPTTHSEGPFEVRMNYFISWPEAFGDFILPSMVGVSWHLDIASTSRLYWRTGHMKFLSLGEQIDWAKPIEFLLVSTRKSCRQEGYRVFLLLPHMAFLYI